MSGLSITGQMKVATLKRSFLKEFGLTLRIYDGRSFADQTQTLAQVRKNKGSGKALSVAKNMKVGNLEDKFEKEFGLKVQVAGSNDSYLCKNELTLNAAQKEDEKKLARKGRKAVRQTEVRDESDDEAKDEKSVQYSIDYKDAEYASTIQWLSEDYKITDLVPYISAIICDGGEDYEELWGDDFNVVSLDGFSPKEGEGEDVFVLCYSAVIEFNADKFPKFKDALEFSSNQVEIKIGFKLPNGDDLDEEVCEGFWDIPTELKALVSGAEKEAGNDKDGDKPPEQSESEDSSNRAKLYGYYNLRFGYCDQGSNGDFIDNISGDYNIYVATGTDSNDDDHLLIYSKGNFEAIKDGDIQEKLEDLSKTLQPLFNQALAKGLIQSGYEYDPDGIIDHAPDFEEHYFDTTEDDDVDGYAPCYFVVGSVTYDCECEVDLASGKIYIGEEIVENFSDFYGYVDEDGTYTVGVVDYKKLEG